jgi:hypothetical protein
MVRKAVLVISVIAIVAAAVLLYPALVEKPALNAEGEMGIRIAVDKIAPESHKPIDWWRTHHPEIVNRGDLDKVDCVYCHVPETSCNNCHHYVGVDAITVQR